VLVSWYAESIVGRGKEAVLDGDHPKLLKTPGIRIAAIFFCKGKRESESKNRNRMRREERCTERSNRAIAA